MSSHRYLITRRTVLRGAAAATAAALRLRRGLGLLDKHERRGQHQRAEKPEDERQTLHNSYLRR